MARAANANEKLRLGVAVDVQVRHPAFVTKRIGAPPPRTQSALGGFIAIIIALGAIFEA